MVGHADISSIVHPVSVMVDSIIPVSALLRFAQGFLTAIMPSSRLIGASIGPRHSSPSMASVSEDPAAALFLCM